MNIEKISVDGYYVWVDKDVTLNYSVGERNGFQYDYKYDVYYYRSYKIVAASSELNLNISALNKVPTYVEWLAKQEVGWWDKDDDRDVMNFIKGYQTAEKEKSDEVLTKYQEGMSKGLELCKKLYTEDDVKRAIEIVHEWYNSRPYFLTTEEIIEQLKQGGNK